MLPVGLYVACVGDGGGAKCCELRMRCCLNDDDGDEVEK